MTPPRRRAPPAKALALAAAAAGLLLGGSAGAWGAGWLDTHTSGRRLLSPAHFQLVVPGVKATGLSLAETARSGLADGHLILQTRLFGARERLVPHASDIATFEVRLAAGSDPVELTTRSATGEMVLVGSLAPDGVHLPNGQVVAHAAPRHAVVEFHDGAAWAGHTRLAPAAGGVVELAPDGSAALEWLRGSDAEGKVVVEDDFEPPLGPTARALWATWGAGIGAALAWGLSSARATLGGRLAVLASLALPAWCLLTPYAAWAALAERVYLVDVDMGALRRLALALALVPTALGVLGLRDALDPDRLPRRTLPGWAAPAAVIGSALLGARGLSGAGWGLLVVGLVSAWLPHRLARASGLANGGVLLRDAPALLAPALLGWGYGLLPALGWRLWCVVADAPRLVRRDGAGAGVEALLALGLLVPIGLEGSLRAGPTDRWWDADALAGASVGGADVAAAAVPFWSGTCHESPWAAVYTFGGSSAGGAWQLRASPESFFPARLHARLCDAGLSVQSFNFGEGGRDSFDAAQAAPALFADTPPALVVAYLGVNDLLSRDAPLTRRQRADALAARAAPVGWLDRASSASRLITGLGLLVRPRETGRLVSAVPVEDAEVNLRAIVAEAARHGGFTLLVPELTRADEAQQVEAYRALMLRLGDELADADAVDVRAGIGPALEPYFVDRNHFDAAGSDALAAALAPAAEAALRAREPR